MSDEELKKLVESNAHAIEALTANVSELTREHQEMYRLMANMGSAQADFYRRLGPKLAKLLLGTICNILKYFGSF